MILRPPLRLDTWMLLSPICLVLVGMLLLYSATYPQEAQPSLLESIPVRQGIYALFGLLVLLLVARIDYRLLGNFAPVLYGFALLLLCVVLLFGESVSGVRRWIDVKLFLVQPAELAKPLVAIALAKYFSELKEEVHSLRTLVGSLAIVVLPMALVYFQPDLGTAIVFASIWLGMAVMRGVSPLHLTLLGLFGLAAAPFMYIYLLHPYMQRRLLLFLDPAADPLGAGYNVLQSEISVGSGGLFGKGLLNGTQSQLNFLRVQETDFIFSVLGEELGFVGAMVVFALFLVLLLRGLQVAALARDDFGRLLATGIVMTILAQVFINVGVNIRLLPVTGIPLPFLSFGGSSLLSVLFSLGILQSIYVHRK